jgi:hypothetical protein
MKLVSPSPALLLARRNFVVFDDFLYYNNAELWTSLAADMGVTAPADTDKHGGQVSMATGATDNNEVGVFSTQEITKFANNQPFIFEAKVQYAEATTDDANVCVGLAQEAAANLLVDNGAGPATTLDGALIYKVDGETVWRAACSNATTQVITKSTTTAGGTAFQVLRIEGWMTSSTEMQIAYYVDGKLLEDANKVPIVHTLTYTGMDEMEVVAGYVKAGGAASETLILDYCFFESLRNN